LHERHYLILTTATHSLARNIKEESPYKPENFAYILRTSSTNLNRSILGLFIEIIRDTAEDFVSAAPKRKKKEKEEIQLNIDRLIL
jgi:hypothetical protein